MKTLPFPLYVLTPLALLISAAPAQVADPAQARVEIAPKPESSVTISDPAAPSPAVNHIRIVRLSQVSGHVRLDRNTGQKFEAAFVNLPIVAGECLQTLDGLAEVEFEDNSSLRLTPNSLVEFPVLERNASGATNSGMKLISGTLYASMTGKKGADLYTIAVGNRTVTLTPSSHIRLDVPSGSAATLTVFKGDVSVADASGTLAVSKRKTLTFDPTSSAQPVIAKTGGEPTSYDEWDKNSADYHKVSASASSFAGSPYSYGVNDLSYYGSFSNVGGCGSLWRPYLASAAWNPYGAGIWTFYPGAGYSWVSPYPWGWTPYHSGSWEYCGGSGWGWRPQGGSWTGLGNQALLQRATGTGVARPITPHPPASGQPTLVPVNLKSLPVSRPASGEAFAFRGDSAGLGVPRGAFSNLGKLSRSAEQHNFAPTPVAENQMQRVYVLSNHTNSTARMSGADAQSEHAGTAAFSRAASTHSSQPSGGFSNSSARSSSPSPSFSAPSAAASSGNTTSTHK